MRLYHVTLCMLVWVCCYSKKQRKVNATPEKCEKWAGRFDRCLSKGFEPKHFQCEVEEDADLTDLTEKEQIRCRRVERRLKYKCSYSCPPVIMPGAPYEVEVTEPGVLAAADVIVNQLRDRAIQNQALGDTETIVRGNIVKAVKQVVSGQRFILTLELGVTDNVECQEVGAIERVVSADQCPHGQQLGLYKITLIHAPWVTPQYRFEEFEDVEGVGMREKYWLVNEDEEELDDLKDGFLSTLVGPVMPGAPYEVEVTEPGVLAAADVIVNQLRDRAIQNQALGDTDVIVKGDVIRAIKQVVSGYRFTITLQLGVTDKGECRSLAEERIVSVSQCEIDNLGLYEVTLISAPWKTPQYTFEKFEDIDGQKLTASFWG